MLTNRKPILVEFGDCDPAGIVFNPCYFAWFDAALHALLRHGGYTFDQLKAEFGIDGIPVVETRAKFRLPLRYGDEVVVDTAVTKVHRCAFDLRHQVFKGELLAAEGFETRVWIAFDATEGRNRARSLPPEITAVLLAGGSR